MFKNKNVLVTGGAGFIGSHLCDEILKNHPRSLTILDNMSLGNLRNLDEVSNDDRSHIIIGDASDYLVLKDVIDTYMIDIVFNLAVIPLPASLSNPYENIKVNIGIVNNLCDIQRQGKFDTLVHFSSSEVYGSAQYVPMDETHPYTTSTPYAASKAAGDLIALSYKKTFQQDIMIVRPFNNYGPRQNSQDFAGLIPLAIRKMIEGNAINIHGDGNQTRDYIYVKDTVGIVLKLYENRKEINGTVNIATGVQTSTNDVLKSIADLMPWDHCITSYITDRVSNVTQHCGDISLLTKICGDIPLTTLADGLKETVKWYKKNEY